MRLRHSYSDYHGADFQKVRDCLLTDDRHEARRLAHSLKGAAGALGAHAVQHVAAGLEAAIKENHPAAEISQLIDECAALYARVQQDIARLKPANSSAHASNTLDASATQAIIGNMRQQLINSDFSATQTLARHQDLFGKLLGEQQKQFENYLNSFEFERALALFEHSQKGDSHAPN